MKEDLLDRIRIASPCNVSWESMSGTERARFCNQCQLLVYDISQLTHKEAGTLIASTQGRVCARIYRRSDGTVLTRDCPVGLRALRRRASRMTGAALTALLSLFSVAVAQKRTCEKNSKPSKLIQIRKKKAENNVGSLKGVVRDPNGAIIPKAQLTLWNTATQETFETCASASGEFIFPTLSEGTYKLEVKDPNSGRAILAQIELSKDTVDGAITLEIDEPLMGVIDLPIQPIIPPPGTMILSGDTVRSLPH